MTEETTTMAPEPGGRALGMIETKGLVAAVEAADAMVKAAGVTLLDRYPVGGGYVAVMVRGDVGAVRTAVEAGSQAAGRIGQVVSAQVLPGPHVDLESHLPEVVEDGS